MPRYLLGLCVVGFMAALTACDKSDLEPAAPAPKVGGFMQDAAGATLVGVHVVAQADEWIGDADSVAEVTPFYVFFRNDGDVPLRIEYRHMKLVSAAGTELAAIPPHRVTGTPLNAQVDAEGRAQPLEFAYPNAGFELAPYYSSTYRNLPTYRQPFVAAQEYHGTTYDYWQTSGRAPTLEMRMLALPEGVLHPGGYVQGYVYFEKIQPGTRHVEFNASLIDAQTGDIFAIVRLPFTRQSD